MVEQNRANFGLVRGLHEYIEVHALTHESSACNNGPMKTLGKVGLCSAALDLRAA